MAKDKKPRLARTSRSQLRCIDVDAYVVADDGSDEPWGWGPPFRSPITRSNLCNHWRQPVEIAQETVVYASAYCDRPRNYRWDWPQIGIYLSDAWAGEVVLASFAWAGPEIGPRAEIAILPWPDGGTPLFPRDTERVLSYGLEAARAGRLVEVGCHAGHGRTGTALTALMILAGAEPDEALNTVWSDYCEFAVETVAQERYLRDLANRFEGSIDGPSREV